MREHWGAAIGHTYTCGGPIDSLQACASTDTEDIEDATLALSLPTTNEDHHLDYAEDANNPEYSMSDQEDELYNLSEGSDADIDIYEAK
jgi:hypothetical protein